MRKLEQIILSGQWAIEPIAGLQILSKYLHEIDLVEKGVKLDYSEQRAALEPKFLSGDYGRDGLTSSDIPQNSIVKLSLSGAMRLENGLSSRGVRQLTQDIAAADANPNISGILLEVNSPGGESVAGAELKNALDDVRSNGRTKVVVYAQTLASAAVRGTLPADYIFASNEGNDVGSVGTMISIDKEWLAYLKESVLDIYADQSTQKNIEFRELIEGNEKPLRKLLTETNQHFINEVQSYRYLKGSEEQIKEVTSGKLFTADVALQRGLIDGIGTFQQAVNKLQELISPDSGNYNNYNTETMNFKSFIASLIPALNQKLGLEVKTDAEPQEVIDAVNGAKSIDERVEELKAEQTKKFDELNTKFEAMMAEFETMKAEKADLESNNQELQSQIEELTAQSEQHSEAKKALEAKIVELKGKQVDTDVEGLNGEVNNGAPNADQFKTAQAFYGILPKTGVGSEY